MTTVATIISGWQLTLFMVIIIFYVSFPPFLIGILSATIIKGNLISRIFGPFLSIVFFAILFQRKGLPIMEDFFLFGLVIPFSIGFSLIGVSAARKFRDGIHEAKTEQAGDNSKPDPAAN